MEIIRILSTKELSNDLLEKMEVNGIECIQHNFIEFKPVDFNPELINLGPNNWIITSQTAWSFLKEKIDQKILGHKTFFCVGEKTRAEIESEGYPVFLAAKNSKTLAKSILAEHPKKSFQYFCGDQRMTYLPTLFQKHNIDWYENVIYETLMTSKKIDEPLDGVLFYSPSGVNSYFETNLYHDEVCFCIGSTTSISAEEHSDNIIISENSTYESVIDSVIKHYL